MTKKFVASLTKDGFASSRSSFLIPAKNGSPWFEEVATGKRHDTGYLVYTGREIESDAVIANMGSDAENSEQLKAMLDSYIAEIATFKVGNVVAIEASDNNQVRLRLVSAVPKSRPGPKMP